MASPAATDGTALLTAAEVARRLGVKPQTVYAYVSRGLLRRDPASGHRHSLFAADEVERAAVRARRPSRSGALEVVIETQLTALDPAGHLHYRGRDVTELARFRSFEDVASLLWDGDASAPWILDRAESLLLSGARALLGPGLAPVELIPVAVAALCAVDHERGDRRPEAVRRAGARILAGALEILSDSGGGPDGVSGEDDARTTAADQAAAVRLWRALRPGGDRPRPAETAALNAALVLLADHELASSTLAARVAASAWADPYRVVLAGLGPLGGSLHAGAGLAVEAIIDEARASGAAFTVLERRLASGPVPGFGHRVYRGLDPRAVHLLERLPAVSDDAQALRTVDALLEAAAALQMPPPNVDFGLAALCRVMRLPPGSTGTIFTLARIVGLIAHALEEYPHRLRFRPRATYTGPVPR
jgi:citrate synthase